MSRGKRTSPLKTAPRTSGPHQLVVLQGAELNQRVEKIICQKFDLSNQQACRRALLILQKEIDSHLGVKAKYQHYKDETAKLHQQYRQNIERLDKELTTAKQTSDIGWLKAAIKNIILLEKNFVLQDNQKHLTVRFQVGHGWPTCLSPRSG